MITEFEKTNIEIEDVISRWFKCDITGDGAMAEIAKIYEDRRSRNETINVYTQEK